MLAVVIKWFRGGYQVRHGREQKVYRAVRDAPSMSGPRMFVAFLGLIMALVGLATALYFERILGIAFIVVGAFLISLPLSLPSD